MSRAITTDENGWNRIAKVVQDVEGSPMQSSHRRGKYPIADAGGSIELCHGVIIEACNPGCSTYRVQRVHRYLKTTCDDCGSGSGSAE